MSKLRLSSFEPLDKLQAAERQKCPKCNAQRKFYCYDCMIEMKVNEDDEACTPKLTLPVDVTVIRHPKEKISKSSIVPAKVLAPSNVEIMHTIDVPESVCRGRDDEKKGEKDEAFDPDSVVLMFPSETAVEISTMKPADLKKIKRVILIDSTWS